MIAKFLQENDYEEGTAAKHFFFSAIVMLNIGVLMALTTTVMTGPLLGSLGYGVVQPPNRRAATAEL